MLHRNTLPNFGCCCCNFTRWQTRLNSLYSLSRDPVLSEHPTEGTGVACIRHLFRLMKQTRTCEVEGRRMNGLEAVSEDALVQICDYVQVRDVVR